MDEYDRLWLVADNKQKRDLVCFWEEESKDYKEWLEWAKKRWQIEKNDISKLHEWEASYLRGSVYDHMAKVWSQELHEMFESREEQRRSKKRRVLQCVKEKFENKYG